VGSVAERAVESPEKVKQGRLSPDRAPAQWKDNQHIGGAHPERNVLIFIRSVADFLNLTFADLRIYLIILLRHEHPEITFPERHFPGRPFYLRSKSPSAEPGAAGVKIGNAAEIRMCQTHLIGV